MTQQCQYRGQTNEKSLELVIARLAREASVEINVHDIQDLGPSRQYLPTGQKVFVSFLPKQTWKQTEAACYAVKHEGLYPVPHIPVRLLADQAMLDETLERLTKVGVEEVLLLSGDYPQSHGVFTCVEDVLETQALAKHGLRAVSFAGHPEGHPKVTREEIRRAEVAKATKAAALGTQVSMVTQFFFEAEPFLIWANLIRAAGVQARLIAGLAGPAKMSTLFKFALRCGAGPSIRALGARPSAFMHLIGDHGPQTVLRELAEAQSMGLFDLAGIHLFCFGGYLRTCKWLHQVGRGEFALNEARGFDLT